MNNIFEKRAALKQKLRRRERLFVGWVSSAHPSITETFARAGFDFIAIDMEHSTISLEQAPRIIVDDLRTPIGMFHLHPAVQALLGIR